MPTLFLSGMSSPGHYPPFLGPCTEQLVTIPAAQTTPKLSKLSNAKPAQLCTLPHPFLPAKTTKKAFAHTFPSLIPPSD